MCVSPITITRRLQNYDSPSRTLRYLNAKPTSLLSSCKPFAVNKVTVPCGKCIECLKSRQNDLACRAAREAQKRGSMVFCTLTYDNEHLPLSCKLQIIDKETGEINEPFAPSVLSRCDSGFCSDVRSDIFKLPVGRFPRYVVKVSSFTDLYESLNEDLFAQYVITPSLNREDVRLWLKRCRVYYKREFGRDCPDFSYCLVGEFGPNTCRPHYHIAFFGLPYKDCLWFLSNWTFGFTNCKNVNAVNVDGTPGFVIASKYIGKYMTKGRFECDSVKCKYAEKPRLCMSKHFGTDLDNRLVSYFRAYDLYGEYDIQSLRLKKTNMSLSDAEIIKLYGVVRQRSHFSLNGYNFLIPNSIIKKLWYVKKDSGSLESSTIRAVFSSLVQNNFLEDFARAYRDSCDESSRSFSQVVGEFLVCSENASLFKDSFDEKGLQTFYNKSLF